MTVCLDLAHHGTQGISVGSQHKTVICPFPADLNQDTALHSEGRMIAQLLIFPGNKLCCLLCIPCGTVNGQQLLRDLTDIVHIFFHNLFFFLSSDTLFFGRCSRYCV